jgi:hypothetical protein
MGYSLGSHRHGIQRGEAIIISNRHTLDFREAQA